MKDFRLWIITLLFGGNLSAQTNLIGSTGNVGIGTTSPNNLFSVKGNSAFGAADNAYVGPSQYGGIMFPRGQLLFSNTNGQNQMYLVSNAYINSSGAWAYRNSGSTAGIGIDGGGIALMTAPTGAADSAFSYTSRLTVLNDGKVGIGTNVPSAAFDVGNLIQISGVNSYTPTGSGVSYGLFSYNGVGLGIFSGAVAPDQGIGIWTNPAGIPQESFRILSGGNVGIGIINPSEKLSVNGNIRAKKVVISQTGWSDYVFEPGYQLRPVSALETFIKQNKHLPEVPSAREIEQRGISVGDNQALLLKKIEELTLYVIDLKKQNEEQQRQINRLANTVKKMQR